MIATTRTMATVVAILALWEGVANGQARHAPPPSNLPMEYSTPQLPANPTSCPPVPAPTDAHREAAFPDVTGHTVHDTQINYLVLFDQFEWQAGSEDKEASWDRKDGSAEI